MILTEYSNKQTLMVKKTEASIKDQIDLLFSDTINSNSFSSIHQKQKKSCKLQDFLL